MAGENTRKRVTRRQLVTAAGGAAVGGLIVGGAGGYAAGDSGGDGGGSGSASGGGGGGGGGGGAIKIGAPIPLSGPYAADGQEMDRGQELAVRELNERGGIGGRQIERVTIDIEDMSPDKMVNAARRLTSRDKVAAIFMGYTTTTSAEFDVIGQSGTPMFHVNTLQANADHVKKNKITNIYHSDPTEIWYGEGLIKLLRNLEEGGTWKPSKRSAAIVTSNDPYSISIAQTFRKGIEKEGWEVSLYEEVTAPLAEWGPTLAKIRRDPPGVILNTDYIPGDLAAFTKQFATDPTPSLLYEQYGPSVPEYLELAGDSADGVLWSTVIGTLPDEIGNDFLKRYEEQFDSRPGLSQAGAQYDLVRLWAQSAAMAGDPMDFERVNEVIKRTNFRGVSGAYTFKPEELTVPPYPDEVNDPSRGMAHMKFQIQDGKQVLIDPSPYAEGEFKLPPWL